MARNNTPHRRKTCVFGATLRRFRDRKAQRSRERRFLAAFWTHSGASPCRLLHRRAHRANCCVPATCEENVRGEIADRDRCNALLGDRRFRGRLPAPAARAGLFGSSGRRQDADRQGPDWQGAIRQGSGCRALLIARFSRLRADSSLRGAKATKQSRICALTGLLRFARNDEERKTNGHVG
jgi:hypothetical protein